MQSNSHINICTLVQQIHALCPNLACNDEQASIDLRRKLYDQLIYKIPQVELERLDLNCIIMNVKKSLSEFQRRIDDSVAQQQLRRTTRSRKSIQEPGAVNFFKPNLERRILPSIAGKPNNTLSCSNGNCCHEMAELSGLVQVESLPISATTNLITIFVPSILQEKLHSCKYKISIDLNRLDLTKKILDLNVGQHVSSNIETDTKENSAKVGSDLDDQESQEHKVIYEIKDNTERENAVEVVETRTSNIEKDPKIEVKVLQDTDDLLPSKESAIFIEAKTQSPLGLSGNSGTKRKKSKPPCNDPPKKRGRKPGSKNKKKTEKSELAKYVEMFACTAGSPSAVSQIVTSTTQNWDITPEQNGQIAYFMNGEWTLSGPSNDGRQIVSTTNCPVSLEEAAGGVQETFIPFEDFVNYIENPSLDAGSNVIARVLDGSVDTSSCNINSTESDALSLSIELPKEVKCIENIDAMQQKLPIPKVNDDGTETSSNQFDLNVVHLTPKISGSDGVLDLSKETNDSLKTSVLDLTRKKTDSPKSPGKLEGKTVVFSTSRSMPSLDDIEVSLFCSPQHGEQLEKKVVFSISSTISPTPDKESDHKEIGQSDQMPAIEIESKKNSDSIMGNFSKNALIYFKDKTKPEIIKGMSLLEIEKNIDDSLLDFDNCMDDDLLSLAPSYCFNSPTEDRFADTNSFDTEESSAKSSTCLDSSNNTPAPRSHLELNVLNNKEDEINPAIRNFKIPRMRPKTNSISGAPLTNITIKRTLEHETHKSPNSQILSGCAGKDTKLFHKSINSTNTKNYCVKGNNTSDIFTPRTISTMFGSPCYGFLADKCTEINCKFNHQFVEVSIIVTSLCLLSNEVLHSAYKFVWRHNKLFKFYFPMFCEEYARRKMRVKLVNMITDCEMQPNCLSYIRNIYFTLIGTGLNKINACRFVLNRVKEKSHKAIDILLDIIIESEASLFSNAIEQFSQIAGYKFRMKNINELATACLHSNNADLITVLIKCLISVDQTEFLIMRSPELVQLLEMIKTGSIDGL